FGRGRRCRGRAGRPVRGTCKLQRFIVRLWPARWSLVISFTNWGPTFPVHIGRPIHSQTLLRRTPQTSPSFWNGAGNWSIPSLCYNHPLDTGKSDAMSYVIHIWEEPVPTSLEHAGGLVGELIRAPKTAVPNPKYVEAAARLTAKYPFGEDPEVDPEGEVWSDG